MAKFLCSGLPSVKTEWGKWVIGFCDERCVPFTDADSTYRVYKEGLIHKVKLTENNFIKIDPTLNGKLLHFSYIIL